MMKRLINLLSILALIVVVSACCGEKGCDETATTDDSNEVKEVKVLTIREVYDAGTELEDKTITVSGKIDHVCRHSKKRFTLSEMDGNLSMKVELKEVITDVNSLTVGRVAMAKGKLLPTHMNLEEVKAWKEELVNHHVGLDNDEHYEAEMIHIDGIIEKMEAGEMKQYTHYDLDAEEYILAPEKK